MSESKQVGVLLIATRLYKQFVPDLLNDLDEKFLVHHNVTVYLFTDEIKNYSLRRGSRIKIIQTLIESYKWPYPTLYRYRIFTKIKYPECDFLYYVDVDMSIADTIGDEILQPLVAVAHCGFYKGGGSWETREESQTYVPPEKRKRYYAGGFQGGATSLYYAAMLIMEDMIATDEKNGIIPIWHDESAFNKYLSSITSFTELPPSYCLVEQVPLRKAWGVDQFEPKIVALAKDHKKIRE